MDQGGTRGPRQAGRLAGIEGLRAIAATSVLVYHVWLYGYGAGGTAGVDLGIATKGAQNLASGVTLFFVLSGFLLYRPFAAAVMDGSPWPSIRKYFRNRALRILPAYWFILFAVTILWQREALETPQRVLANALFLRELIPAYATRVTADDPAGGYSGIGIAPAWSLSIEVCFYLALPLLCVAALRLARSSTRPLLGAAGPVLLMFGIGIFGQLALRWLPTLGHGWAHSLVPFTGYFATGMAVAVAYVAWESGRVTIHPASRYAVLAGGALIAAIAIKLWYAGALTYLESQGIVAIGLALGLCFVLLSPHGSRTTTMLQWRPVAAAGLISYSVFLWHDPIVREMRDAGLTAPGVLGFVLNVLTVGAVTAAAATLTYLYVERPALARKRVWAGAATAANGAGEPAAASRRGRSKGTVDVREIVRSAISGIPSAETHEIVVEAPVLLVPTEQRVTLTAGVRELVDNALRYGAEPITVVCDREGDTIRFAITDAGRGVTPEFEGRLFEPGTRSETSRIDEPKRHGLGLATARAAARELGGDVVHIKTDFGARFDLVVPADVPSTRRRAKAVSLSAAASVV